MAAAARSRLSARGARRPDPRGPDRVRRRWRPAGWRRRRGSWAPSTWPRWPRARRFPRRACRGTRAASVSPAPGGAELIVSPADRRRQGSLYAWSPKAWDRFLGRMSDVPLTARLELSELDEHGTPGAGVYFSLRVDRDFHSRHSRWTRLTAHLQPRADDDAVWEATAQRWAGFLTDYAALPGGAAGLRLPGRRHRQRAVLDAVRERRPGSIRRTPSAPSRSAATRG